MTRPLYEPTPAKTASYLNYGVDQLQRRPSPQFAGTTIFPSFRARKKVDPQTIIAGPENIVVCWDCWEICDESVFAEEVAVAGSCTGNLTGVQLNATGVYAIHAQVQYEGISVNYNTAIGMFDTVNERMWYDLGDWLSVGTAGPSLAFQVVRAYNEFDAITIRIETMHTSPTDESIGSDDTGGSCFFQVFYLGNYDCDDCPGSATEIYIGGGGTCDNC